MARQQELEPLEALAGTLAAMAEAARCTGGGVRTVGRRTARAGAGLSRRAWESGLDRGRRANVAIRVYRGDERTFRRRPSEYVTTGVVMGFAGAFAVVAVMRAIMRRSESAADVTATDATAASATATASATVPDDKRIRSLAGRIKRFRSGPAPIKVPEPTATAQPTATTEPASAASKNGVTEVTMPTSGSVRP
jgi:hypothetical protein